VPKIKNVSGEARNVPGLGGRLVLPGQVVEFPADQVYNYTCQQGNWECADKAATEAHNEDTAAEQARANPEPSAAPDPTEG